MKVLRVEMSDGWLWDIPASVIADSRAKYFSEIDPDTTYDNEFSFAMEDGAELRSWASNNMDWEDVSPHAKFHMAPATYADYDSDWVNAHMEVIEKGGE